MPIPLQQSILTYISVSWLSGPGLLAALKLVGDRLSEFAATTNLDQPYAQTYRRKLAMQLLQPLLDDQEKLAKELDRRYCLLHEDCLDYMQDLGAECRRQSQ